MSISTANEPCAYRFLLLLNLNARHPCTARGTDEIWLGKFSLIKRMVPLLIQMLLPAAVLSAGQETNDPPSQAANPSLAYRTLRTQSGLEMKRGETPSRHIYSLSYIASSPPPPSVAPLCIPPRAPQALWTTPSSASRSPTSMASGISLPRATRSRALCRKSTSTISTTGGYMHREGRGSQYAHPAGRE